jgi:hypothetical protein
MSNIILDWLQNEIKISQVHLNNKENLFIRRIIFKWIPIRLHTRQIQTYFKPS